MLFVDANAEVDGWWQ